MIVKVIEPVIVLLCEPCLCVVHLIYYAFNFCCPFYERLESGHKTVSLSTLWHPEWA